MCCCGNTRNNFCEVAHPNSNNIACKFSASGLGGVKMEFNSTYWRERAREMRKVADQTKDPQSKRTMLGIAHGYDHLACQFEYRETWTMRGTAQEKARRDRAMATASRRPELSDLC